ncbi:MULTISPECIES: TetR/AcrR family transcriptional regulator [Frankia]|uniref:TetR-family transcriptional regulator n=1 Tax=Frankia alni (strain DSM 45986 / CECT 9034 / ACN14a) TaxID=326424 RepID=Q0RU31_FRAAA|nr:MULTISPECIES: TetR/AcrR family transcriptional regulator [Frankia]CAJ58913.1 putative TetR-family transcriptional regulator [Frankia alni ACN14a]
MVDQAESQERGMRSHARRNRERILAVAREALASRDGDISLNEVARRAGVGTGTLFRHFPSRDALLEALLHDRTAALCAEAERLLGAADAATALFDWLADLISHVAIYQGVSAALLAGSRDEGSELHRSCRAVDLAAESLLIRAQRTEQVRADVRPDEVISLVSALSWVKEQSPDRDDHVRALLTVMVDGLRTFPSPGEQGEQQGTTPPRRATDS